MTGFRVVFDGLANGCAGRLAGRITWSLVVALGLYWAVSGHGFPYALSIDAAFRPIGTVIPCCLEHRDYGRPAQQSSWEWRCCIKCKVTNWLCGLFFIVAGALLSGVLNPFLPSTRPRSADEKWGCCPQGLSFGLLTTKSHFSCSLDSRST